MLQSEHDIKATEIQKLTDSLRVNEERSAALLYVSIPIFVTLVILVTNLITKNVNRMYQF